MTTLTASTIRRAALVLLATVLPGLSLAASGAEAGPGDAPVSRLVLRLRPDARPAGNAPLAADRLAELQSVLGQSLAGSTVTSAGNQVLELATPVSATTAKQLVNTLRMHGDIVWAEVERVPRPMVPKSSLAAESPSIRRLIVTFADPQWAMASRSNASAGADRDAELSNAAGTPLHVTRPSVGGAWIVELPAAVDTATARAIAAALQSSGVARLAVPAYRVRPMAVTPNDSFYISGDQWYLQDKADTGYAGIDAAHAWDITTGSPGMVIAVVDTGIVPHPDLGRVIPGYDFVSDATGANDGDGRDPDPTDPGDWRTTGLCPAPFNTRENSDWHGTMVAGVIAADTDNAIGIAGIDWNARILDVRALGRCGGDFSDILDAMTWSAGLRVPGVPMNPNPAKVINLSVGGDGPCDGQIQAMLEGDLPTDRSGADRMRARDRAQQAGLANPVASQQAGHRTHFRRQRNPAQRNGSPIVQIDIIDFKHRRPPCHCEERIAEAISVTFRARNPTEIASSLRSSQ